MSYVLVGDEASHNNLATVQTLTAPSGANAAFVQTTIQDVYLDLGGDASTASSLELSTLDGIREVYVGFGGALTALQKAATAVLKVQWIRTGRRRRDG